jgi:hypothetical protein
MDCEVKWKRGKCTEGEKKKEVKMEKGGYKTGKERERDIKTNKQG